MRVEVGRNAGMEAFYRPAASCYSSIFLRTKALTRIFISGENVSNCPPRLDQNPTNERINMKH
jgi:hypothetical protein